jgi:hypothetical protein
MLASVHVLMMGRVNLIFNVIYGSMSLGSLAIWHRFDTKLGVLEWFSHAATWSSVCQPKKPPPAFSANSHIKHVCVDAAAISDDGTPDFPSSPARTSQAAVHI